jgi:hypothetical protein
MAVIGKTVKASGGDYSTLISWEAGEQTNLVTDGDSHQVFCDPFEDDAGTTGFVLAGWGTGASNNILITGTSYPDPGWDETSCFTWRCSGGYPWQFSIQQDYTTLAKFQIHMDSASNALGACQLFASDVVARHVNIKIDESAANGYGVIVTGTVNVENCVVFAATASAITTGYYCGSGTLNCYNCLMFWESSGSGAGFKEAGAGTVNVTNCVSFNGSNDFAVSSATTCATSEVDTASGLSGATHAYEITDNWTDSSDMDFTWTSFSDIDGEGTDASGSLSNNADLYGNSWLTGDWDMGPFNGPAVTDVENTIGIQSEFVLKMEKMAATPSEFLLDVSRTISIMAEVWSDIVSQTFSLQAEVLGSVSSESDIPSEFVLDVNGESVSVPAEVLLEVGNTVPIQGEFLLDVSNTVTIPGEVLLALEFAGIPVQTEHLLTVEMTQTFYVVFEFTGSDRFRIHFVTVGAETRVTTIVVPGEIRVHGHTMPAETRSQVGKVPPETRTQYGKMGEETR